jgi:hypothetical protein
MGNPVSSFTDVFSSSSRDEPSPSTGFKLQPVQQLMQLLKGFTTGQFAQFPELASAQTFIAKQGTEKLGTTEEDRQKSNLEAAELAVTPQLDALEDQITRSSGARGTLSGGEGATQIAAARGAAFSKIVSDALARSFQEAQAQQELGGQLLGGLPGFRLGALQPQLTSLELLTQLISGLAGAGTGLAGSTFSDTEATRRQLSEVTLDKLAPDK